MLRSWVMNDAAHNLSYISKDTWLAHIGDYQWESQQLPFKSRLLNAVVSQYYFVGKHN